MIMLYNDRKVTRMSKTVRYILKVLECLISALLGAGGTYTLMS